MQITFSDEAAETFNRFLGELNGLAGSVTTDEGETFDAMLGPTDLGSTNRYDAMRVRPWDFDNDTAAGAWRTVNVESVEIF